MSIFARREPRLGALLVLAACAAPPPAAFDPAVADVAAATNVFLGGLSPELRTRSTRALDSDDRTTWAFVPGRYPGVELGDLDAAAMERARALLRALLSAPGFAKTFAIVQLEDVLRELEGRGGRDASHRDPRRYTLLVCGEPATEGAFSVRLQGHHVSLHFTFFAGLLVGATPHFLGSNPHALLAGPDAGKRVLAAEEDLARELLASCTASQRTQALLAETAPPDVFLGPGKGVDALGERRGLPATAMTAAQRELLVRLVEQFAGNLRHEFAVQEMQRLRPELDDATFAWAGGSERGEGHYWRVHGRTFAIEYDNTQNDANHVHVLWRDFERDFGGDTLRRHHAEHHRE
jgi:hypothetical protein